MTTSFDSSKSLFGRYHRNAGLRTQLYQLLPKETLSGPKSTQKAKLSSPSSKGTVLKKYTGWSLQDKSYPEGRKTKGGCYFC